MGEALHNKIVGLRSAMDSILLLNDREAAGARDRLKAIESALSPQRTFALTAAGLSAAVVEKHHQMMKRRRDALQLAIGSYDGLKRQDSTLLENWSSEPGVVLVLARIFQGLSQRQLAERLGMREQQVQRYEADRYRSISLSNLKRVCAHLNVEIAAHVTQPRSSSSAENWPPDKLDPNELRRVLNYVRVQGWLPERDTRLSDEDGLNALIDYATSARDRFGSPTYLRTGLGSSAKVRLLSLHTWRARITDLARAEVLAVRGQFDPTDISWLRDLVKLSRGETGPTKAVELLESKGILLRFAPAVPGITLDGAAFLHEGVPVIGMTLRHDRVDYFWFTLLHELGHVFLHIDQGLNGGFFDDLDDRSTELVEQDANEFAASCIVAPELWRLSPARLAKAPAVVHSLARELGISPALIFGKIRNERNDYKIFSDQLGQGSIRPQFFHEEAGDARQPDHLFPGTPTKGR